MPKLLNNAVPLVGTTGTSTFFITLETAQPNLGTTPSPETGYTLITGVDGQLQWTNTLGKIAFQDGVINSSISDGDVTFRSTGSGVLTINGNVFVDAQEVSASTATISNYLRVSSTAQSTSSHSGNAVSVEGGISASVLFVDYLYANNQTVLNTATIVGVIAPSTGTYIYNEFDTFYIVNTGVIKVLPGVDISITNENSVYPGGGDVTVNNTSTLETVTRRGSITTSTIKINNNTPTTSTNSGALTVSGGVGIGNNLAVGGIVYIGTGTGTVAGDENLIRPTATDSFLNLKGGGGYSKVTVGNSHLWLTSGLTSPIIFSTNATSRTSGGFEVMRITSDYMVGIGTSVPTSKLTVDGTVLISGITTSTNSTSATNTTTGALQIAGGAGIGKKLYVGEEIYSRGNLVLTTDTLGLFGVSKIIAGTGIGVNPTIGTGTVTISNLGVLQLETTGTGINLSTSTGSVVISITDTLQSVSERGSITDRSINITNDTASTSSLTGALVVTGGVGISGSVYANGIYDTNNRVLTSVYPISGNGIAVDAVSNTNGSSTFAINNTGVLSISPGTGTFVSTATGDIVIWNSLNLQDVTSQGSTTDQPIRISNLTVSNSTDTGALIVDGGAGVGGSLYVKGNVYTDGKPVLTTIDISAGTDTNVSISGTSITIWSTATLQSITDRENGSSTTNAILVSNATISNSTNSNQALTVFGGIGAAGIFVNSAQVNGADVWTTATLSDNLQLLNGAGYITSSSIANYAITSVIGSQHIGVTTSSTSGTVIITNLGVQEIAAGVGIDISTSTGSVTISSADTLQTVSSRGSSTDQIIEITNTSNSISTLTGALIVSGGAGIGGNIYAKNIISNGSEVITTATLGSFGVASINSGTGTSVSSSTGNITIWNVSTLQEITNNGNVTDQSISITNGTPAISTESAALTVSGGIGATSAHFSKLNVNDDVTFGGSVTFNGTATYVLSTNTIYTDNLIELHTTSTGAITNWTFDDGKDIGYRFHYYNRELNTGTGAGLILANDTQYLEWYDSGTESVSGVFEGIRYGGFKLGHIKLISNITATSTTTGALTVVGGAGIGKKLYVGEDIYSNGNLVLTTANVGSFGVSEILAGTDTRVSSSIGSVTIWNDSTLQSVTDRGALTNQAISITNTTLATSTNTGALQVKGGVGIGGDIYAKNIISNGSEVITTATIGIFGVSKIVSGTGTSVSSSTGNITIWNVSTLQEITNNGNVTDQAISITNTTSATSTNTGALQVKGGVGIAGNLWVGGTINATIQGIISTATLANTVLVGQRTTNAAHYLTFVDSNDVTPTANSLYTTSSFIVNPSTGNVGIGTSSPASLLHLGTAAPEIRFDDTDVSGVVQLRQSGAAFLITVDPTGADASSNFQVAVDGTERMRITADGNVGIGTSSPASILDVNGNTRISGITTVTNTTPATSTNTGALQVAGGAGIGGDLYVGGNLSVSGNITASVTGIITTATNLAGGSSGQIPYQTDNGVTGFITSPTTADTFLYWTGSTYSWGDDTTSKYTTSSIVAGTLTLDLSLATVFDVVLNNNITSVVISNIAPAGKTSSFVLQLNGDGTARTVVWPTSFRWPGNTAPTLTSTLNKIDVIVAYTNDGGTNWFSFISGQNI